MKTHFAETVSFKAPGGFQNAVALAARRDHMTPSEFLRRAAIGRLREIGVDIEPVVELGAGAGTPNKSAAV